ncbi:MAG: hypothetical protein KC912_08335 [Proteobacteria bacterium]|nr:hypothetical protein [Pseudomonadota bacterium]
MRRVVGVLVVLALAPQAWAPVTISVCSGPSDYDSGTMTQCDFGSVSDALASRPATDAVIEVYTPNDLTIFESFTVAQGITIRGVYNPTVDDVPTFYATSGAAVSVDCLSCTVSLSNFDVLIDTGGDGVEFANRTGLVGRLTDVWFLGDEGFAAGHAIRAWGPSSVIVNGGGAWADSINLGVEDGASLVWGTGWLEARDGPLGHVYGSLTFTESELYSPGDAPGLVVHPTGVLTLQTDSWLDGTAYDLTAWRTDQSLIQVNGGTLAVSNSTLTDGAAATREGSLIYAGIGSQVSLTDSLLQDGWSAYDGGLVHMDQGESFTATGTLFTGGFADANGGAVKLISVPSVSITDSVFSGNEATNGHGGALGLYDTPATLDGVTISDNTAGTEGGGLYLAAGSDATIKGVSRFLTNEAVDGGGIYGLDSSIALNGAFMSGNTATGWGGAVSMDVTSLSASLGITGATLTENTATIGGGAVSTDGRTVVQITNSRLTENQAGAGGALSSATTPTGYVRNTLFCRNSASNGGAIYSFLDNNGTLAPESWNNVVFFANTATGAGGALHADGGNLSLAFGSFDYNGGGAGSGGAVFADYESAVSLTYGIIADTVSGDGLIVGTNQGPSLTFDGIGYNNTTTVRGPGVLGTVVAALADPFPQMSETSTCVGLDWTPSAGASGSGATAGTTPFVPPNEQDADADSDGYTIDQGDCDDTDPAVNPGASELCASDVDDDCDGQLNEASAADAITIYVDYDGDGFGAGLPATACFAGDGYADNDEDCDDDNAAVNPDGNETCDDLNVDEDCDGGADDLDPHGALGRSTYHLDADGDGYGAVNEVRLCDPTDAHIDDNTDCDDSLAYVNPDGQEVCDEFGQIDEDCDGLIDDEDDSVTGQIEWFADVDGDGFGDPDAPPILACHATDYALNVEDCDDSDAGVHPFATDVPGDDIDQNCDGEVAYSYVSGGCGCETGGAPALWLAFPLLGLLRRRR